MRGAEDSERVAQVEGKGPDWGVKSPRCSARGGGALSRPEVAVRRAAAHPEDGPEGDLGLGHTEGARCRQDTHGAKASVYSLSAKRRAQVTCIQSLIRRILRVFLHGGSHLYK